MTYNELSAVKENIYVGFVTFLIHMITYNNKSV